jgi:acyl-CoA synthetase (AMP-forming)/AMP-acid ligase II
VRRPQTALDEDRLDRAEQTVRYGNWVMIEPWDLDWGVNADWTDVPRIEPRVPALLQHFRTHYADRVLLVRDERHFTYGEIEAKAASLARQLIAAGATKGCRIGLLLPSDETFMITWLAVTRIGAVAVTLPTLARPAEIEKIARHADLHFLFTAKKYLHHDYVERLETTFPEIRQQRPPYHLLAAPYLRAVWFWGDGPSPVWAQPVDLSYSPAIDGGFLAAMEAEVHRSDPAGIIYTSGSTAEPKGVIHAQSSLVRQGMKLAASFQYRRDERVYAGLPFFWVGGLASTMLAVMSVGGTLLGSDKTGPELLDFLSRNRMTAVVAWPHMVRSMAADPSFAHHDWSSVRNGLLFEALPPEKRGKDSGLMATPLGMTETCAVYTIMQTKLSEDQRGSVGPLQRGIEARLVDPETDKELARWADGDWAADSGGQVGLQQVRSDVMMLGMVKRENADVFTRDGWYSTGDLCSYRRGHLHFHGRVDDLIKSAGANVSPREVEEVLMQFPGVQAAHATAVPDRTRGSVVGAVVVPKEGVTLHAEDIRRAAAKSLASYKTPRILVVLQGSWLPTLPSSKVDRRALAEMLREAHEAAPQ